MKKLLLVLLLFLTYLTGYSQNWIKDPIPIESTEKDSFSIVQLRGLSIGKNLTKQDTFPVFMLVSYPPSEEHESSPVFTIAGYSYIIGHKSYYLDFDKKPLHNNLIVWMSGSRKYLLTTNK